MDYPKADKRCSECGDEVDVEISTSSLEVVEVIDVMEPSLETSWSCPHYTFCSEECHDEHGPQEYALQCLYCILDGVEWDYEPDSWAEHALDTVHLFEMGVIDGKKYSHPYTPSDEVYQKNLCSMTNPLLDFRNNNDDFRQIYEKGFYYK